MIQRFLHKLLNDRLRDFEVAHHAEFPAQPPIFGKLSSALPGAIEEALLKLPNLGRTGTRTIIDLMMSMGF